MTLPPGYYVEYGGQFENLQRASQRLLLVVPVALFLIFVLLYTTFGAVRPALLIYFNIPIAATGGVVALMLRGMPFSISAAVGFIALFGVAVLNGVVMVSYFIELRRQGLGVDEAVMTGAELRLRPVLMTALVAGPRIRADGVVNRRRGGGAATAGHRRDWGPRDVHDADVAGASRSLSMVRTGRTGGGTVMYEVKAIVRLDRQEDVIAALHAVPDLPGLTISMVEGVGRRHADAVLEPVDFGRATMAKIEIVVGEDRLTQVLDAVTRGAHTGRRGDGKVFVSRVEQALRLRTGETDLNALQ